MIEKVGYVRNPLTVIAIFAAIAEVSGTVVLPFIAAEHQGNYVWFLMLFPFFLVTAFFLTLNFNHRVLYAPSDYKDEKHFFGKASDKEIEEKIEHEASLELSKDALANEAESIDGDEELPGTPEIADQAEESPTKEQLVESSLMFERKVVSRLQSGGIPFPYNKFNVQVSIVYGSQRLLIDCVIETDNVHYLIEIRNAKRPSSLVNAVIQVERYKSVYENYLEEKSIKAVVQPIIIVPSTVSVSGSFRGVPIAKFDAEVGKITNLKDSYPDYIFSAELDESANLSEMLLRFLDSFSRWGFSPLRIQQWGSKQPGFEALELYTVDEIRSALDSLLHRGKLKELTSKRGNRLYKIR